MYHSTLTEQMGIGEKRGGARWVQHYWRRKNRLMVAIIVAVGLAWGVSGYTVYKLNMRELGRQLSTTAKNHARVVEAAAEAAAKNGGLRDLLASFNVRSYGSVSGKSVQFAYGTLQNDLITIYDEGLETTILRLASQSPVAQPMLLALSGQSGTVVANDHKGREVLAAYEPVPGWKLAVVLKITVEEVRAPFLVEASIVAPIIISVLVILLVMLLHTTNPLIRHLERSLAHGEFAADLAKDAIVEIDDDGAITAYNPAAEEIFGYTRATVIGQHIRCLLPDVLPSSSASETAAFLTRKTDKATLQRSDGTTFEGGVLVRGLRQVERSSVTLVFRSPLNNETKHGAANERAELAHGLAEIAAQTLQCPDYRNNFLFAAAKVADVLDVSVCKIWQLLPECDELVLSAAVGVPEDSIGEVRIPVGTSSHAGYVLSTRQATATEAYSSESRFGALDTRPGNALISGLGVPIRGTTNDIGSLCLYTHVRRTFTQDEINFLTVVADLVAMSYQRARVEDRSRCLASAFESSVEPAVITDTEGSIVFVNPAFEVTTGFRRTEAIGNTLQMLASDSSLPWLDSRAQRLLGEGLPVQGTRIDLRRDGSPFANQRTIHPIHNDKGAVSNYLVTIKETPNSTRAFLETDDGYDADLANVAAVAAQTTEAASSQSSERSGGVRILVAEDNADTLKVALRQLGKIGYAAEGVSNGFEVLEAIEKKHFDIIVMDCAMPDMDGWETTSAIRRRDDDLGQTPIIAMTAHTLEGDREQCLAAGMDDFIAKPISTTDLRPVIERWLPGNRPTGSIRRRFGLIYDVYPDSNGKDGDNDQSSLEEILTASTHSAQASAELDRATGTEPSKPKRTGSKAKRKPRTNRSKEA